MNDKPAPEEEGSSKESSKESSRDTPARDTASGDPHERTGTPYIEVGGSQATRELRDTSRRRREAEEKLQQHLMEAKEHAHEAEHAQEAEHARDSQHTADAKEEPGKAKGRSDKAKEHSDKTAAETEER